MWRGENDKGEDTRVLQREWRYGGDAEAMEQHLSELGKEMKKNADSDKVARLLSLTYSTRRTYMSQTSSTHISAALQ